MPIIKKYIEGTLFNQLKYNNFNSGRGPIIQKKIPTKLNERRTTEPREILKRADDTVRIAKLLTRTPGLKFAFNQNALGKVQTNSSKIRNLEGPKQSFLKDLGNGLLSTVKVLGSTLAQVPVNGTGLHFVKGFAGRQGYIQQNGANIVKNGGIVNDRTNVDERNLRISRGTELTVDPVNNFNTQVSSDNGKKLDNTGTFIPQDGVRQPISLKDGYRGASEFNSAEEKDSQVKAVPNLGTKSDQNEYDVNDYIVTKEVPDQIEKKYGKNRYFKKTKEEQQNYWENNPIQDTTDHVNAFPEADFDPTEQFDTINDLIKFKFEVITPGGEDKTENKVKYLIFRAFLDSMSDEYQGEWTPFKYTGRGENFYTYGGFDRNISIGFKVAAMTRAELNPMYRKINYLASTTAPTYNINGFMRGTFVKLTVGDYFSQLPGVIQTVAFDWEVGYPWEIKYDKKNETDVQELPHVLNTQITFKPIHRFVPQTGLQHFTTNPNVDKFFDYKLES